jgi:hypothetical protein
VSRTKPDRFERLGLLTSCPTCHAPGGEWCTTGQYGSPSPHRGTAFAQQMHTARGGHLRAAYWQGYDDGVEAQYSRQRDQYARMGLA